MHVELQGHGARLARIICPGRDILERILALDLLYGPLSVTQLVKAVCSMYSPRPTLLRKSSTLYIALRAAGERTQNTTP